MKCKDCKKAVVRFNFSGFPNEPVKIIIGCEILEKGIVPNGSTDTTLSVFMKALELLECIVEKKLIERQD